MLRLAYMREAFDPREIVAGPSWIGSDTFTVIATSERPAQNRPGARGPVDVLVVDAAEPPTPN